MKQFLQNMVKTYNKMSKQENKQNSKKFQSLQYPECPLGGDHQGEAMSLICLEKDCQKNSILCCCICQEEYHKGHQLKPLKLILCEYDAQIREQQNVSLKQSDKEQLLKKITEQEEGTQKIILEIEQQFKARMKKITESQTDFFENLRKFVKLRELSTSNQYSFIESVIKNQKNLNELSKSVRELLDTVVVDEMPNKDLSSEEINKIFDFHIKESRDHLQQLQKQLIKGMEEQVELLQQKTQKNIFQKSYSFQFLPNNKHQQIEILGSTIVKASNSSHGYKFAVMTPSLDKFNSTTFGFKLNNVHSSNWLAVGACHLSTVQSKQFGFAFQSTGHGGYMVSSNGGSWSSTTANQNNVVKCFKFAKGDTIICTYDPKNDLMIFQKQKTNVTYKLDVPKSDLDLYPCVLFYYALDEVEFILPDQINKQ